MGVNVVEQEDYSLLKDLKVEINSEDGSFSLCFWLYLTRHTPLPCILLRQVHPDVTSDVPFLALNMRKKFVLFPLFLHQEAPNSSNSTPWSEVPGASTKNEFPMVKWVHVGCEVSEDLQWLYIDGEIAGQKPVASLLTRNSHPYGLEKLSLCGTSKNDDKLQGYVHNVELLPHEASIRDHYAKDLPIQLSIDSSTSSEIEEDSDGVWSIVGGKASCRRNFSLDVTLLDTCGQPVNCEVEVVASLLYDDNEESVEKPDDAEAPLLTSYDGIEFASHDRPSKLINGRASFKLKISQLSSKCDNRLFRIRFEIPKMGRYPFLNAFSLPIRCISRIRNTRTSSTMWKKSHSALHLLNGSHSPGLDDGPPELLHNTVREAKSLKRVKLGEEKPFVIHRADPTSKKADEECNSHAWTTNKGNNVYEESLERKPDIHAETDNISTDSESSEATNSIFKSMLNNITPVSDLTVFKYCLGDLTEKSLLLKEIAISASKEEILEFAQQVSLYSGCSHHRNQILMTKKLIDEGLKAWRSISCNSHHALWENLVSRINEHFMTIARCSTRSLTYQDFELLRGVAGCKELVALENFEKMWCWLYPIAFSLSQDVISKLWESTSPKWIEGFITKEEAEFSLQHVSGLQDPGTFILRFPTSRSWPHPDAGNLIVTYVGSDYRIHNRLLSLDFIYSSGAYKTTTKPLQDMLLEEPELSRFGRIIRSH